MLCPFIILLNSYLSLTMVTDGIQGLLGPSHPSFPKFVFLGLYAVMNYALVKVTQGETVISHVKNSPGQDRSGATSIVDARAD